MALITSNVIALVVEVSVYILVIALVIVAEKDLMVVMVGLVDVRWAVTATNIVSVHHHASRRAGRLLPAACLSRRI